MLMFPTVGNIILNCGRVSDVSPIQVARFPSHERDYCPTQQPLDSGLDHVRNHLNFASSAYWFCLWIRDSRVGVTPPPSRRAGGILCKASKRANRLIWSRI
jgi:hypothetical protein